ncbi:serine/threonine-protein kinase PknH/PknJ [Mycobacterium sp. AT1]|uniref:serine/threonine-protein kinase PknH/PknJ n=1 Tax=Mycobacterium sp. AT1 TaxID=1961706 RepID=UPI0009AC96E6|nr:serine/threonine-protein kinase PknH/PknJ [Mycobacterium sp. AT1]OPX05563.1 serine/threonine protein kinase [Mycobacterium sp. AT1]
MPMDRGQKFAGFTVVALLGAGGMGEVYLVEHPRLPRRDALKLLPADVSADPEYRGRFEREADLAAGLWHAHVVGVHDRGEAEGKLWISMDYVDGLDASKVLAQRYPKGMPACEVADIVTAVASALDYAHKQGLLHRDVKPANIMVTHVVDDHGEKRILLTDFGIARNLEDANGLTATNMTVGTVAYAAPEQLMGEAIDGRADQYALAATAYHLLTGSPLYPHSNPAVVISRHLNAAPPALADTRAELASLDPVLAAALAKNPAQRFTRCSDFASAFAEQAKSDAPLSAAPTARAVQAASANPALTRVRSEPPSSPPTQRPPVPVGRQWLRPAAVVAVVTVVLAGIALAWRPWGQAPAAKPPTSSAAPPAPPSASLVAPPPAAPPPPPPVFAASAIDGVLLSPDEVNEILGTSEVATSEGRGLLKVADTTYGMSDNSEIVTPPACVGLLFGAEYSAWGGSGFLEMRNQTLRPDQYASYDNNVPTPSEIEQTVAVFSTADQAQAFMTTSQNQWERCAGGEVRRRYVESGHTYTVGRVQREADLLTVSMAAVSGLDGANACEHALGVRDNVVVGARSCLSPAGITPDGSTSADPDWAGNGGQRVAAAMLDKVTV